ncbi:MAG TPA: glycoside hydrolase family 36 protein [Acidimicrobiales bacterium]|nr:glycoside hydrolase family 36 protein [Acidimicrobiales bacterium]
MRITGHRIVADAAHAGGAGSLELITQEREAGSGVRVDLVLRNPAAEAVRVDRVLLATDATPSMVLEHGWQSWSTVRRTAPSDVRPKRAGAPGWLKAQQHADPGTSGAVVAGDHFLLMDAGLIGALDGRRNLTTVLAHDASPVEVAVLLDSVPIPARGERILDPLWFAAGDPGRLYSEYAGLWGLESGARTTAQMPVGWCSWYEYFTAVRPEQILSNLAHASDHGVDLVQVDDGYQAEIGLWLQQAADWSLGLDAIAEDITKAGCLPGIWTAPFLAAADGAIARERQHFLLREPGTGDPVRAIYNPQWRGWCNALDTTHPEVLEHLRETFASLTDAGYGYQKIDFCYAAAVPGRRHRQDLTRAEALRLGVEAVREGMGDDRLLLGCGCPLAPVVGLVDAMRVSEDVAPYWEVRGAFEGYEEAAPAAKNSVMATVLRAPLHRRVFANDPDCVLLRPTGTLLSAEERRVVLHTAVGAGAYLVLSDDLDRYGPAEWGRLSRATALLPQADTALDIADPFAPTVVVSGSHLDLTVNWTTVKSRLARASDGAAFLP